MRMTVFVMGVILILGAFLWPSGGLSFFMESDAERASRQLDAITAIVKAQAQARSNDSTYTADSDQRVCGRGWNRMCMMIPVPGHYETPPGGAKFVVSQDYALCEDYYAHYIRTGQYDAFVDGYCYERGLKPYMMPDPSR